MVVHGGEQLTCTVSDRGVGVVGVALAGGGVAKSGPVGQGRSAVSLGSGVDGRSCPWGWARVCWLGGRQCDGDDQVP